MLSNAIFSDFAASSTGVMAHVDDSAAQLFEWLALLEAASYEDLRFAAMCNDLTGASALHSLGNHTLQFRLPNTERRLLIIPLAALTDLSATGAGDLVCVRVDYTPENPCCRYEIEALFDVLLAAPEAKVCLSWCCSNVAFERVKHEYNAAEQVEWIWTELYSRTRQRCGLMFSRHWLPGVSAHVARVVGNYIQTLRSGPSAARCHLYVPQVTDGTAGPHS